MEKEIKEIQETIKSCNDKLEALLKKGVTTPEKFEVGKWYKIEDSRALINFQGYGKKHYGFNHAQEWTEIFDNWTIDNYPEKVIPATKEEIEPALIAEAKRRGFRNGAKFKSTLSKNVIERTLERESDWFYNAEKDSLHSCTPAHEWHDTSNPPIYKQGQWAEIIKEDKIEIGGHEVKFFPVLETKSVCVQKESHVKIDGHTFTQEFWQAAKVISEHSKAKIMIGCSKQFDVSLETINKILSKL